MSFSWWALTTSKDLAWHTFLSPWALHSGSRKKRQLGPIELNHDQLYVVKKLKTIQWEPKKVSNPEKTSAILGRQQILSLDRLTRIWFERLMRSTILITHRQTELYYPVGRPPERGRRKCRLFVCGERRCNWNLKTAKKINKKRFPNETSNNTNPPLTWTTTTTFFATGFRHLRFLAIKENILYWWGRLNLSPCTCDSRVAPLTNF